MKWNKNTWKVNVGVSWTNRHIMGSRTRALFIPIVQSSPEERDVDINYFATGLYVVAEIHGVLFEIVFADNLVAVGIVFEIVPRIAVVV